MSVELCVQCGKTLSEKAPRYELGGQTLCEGCAGGIAAQDLPWLRRFELGYGLFFCFAVCGGIVSAVMTSITQAGSQSSLGGALVMILIALAVAAAVAALVLINLHGNMTSLTRQKVVFLTITVAVVYALQVLVSLITPALSESFPAGAPILQGVAGAASICVVGLLLLRVAKLIGQSKLGRSLFGLGLIIGACILALAGAKSLANENLGGTLSLVVFFGMLIFLVYAMRLWRPLREVLMGNEVKPFVPQGWMYAAAVGIFAVCGLLVRSLYA